MSEVKVDKKAIAFGVKLEELRKLYRLVQQDQKQEALALITQMGQVAKREAEGAFRRTKRLPKTKPETGA